MRSTVAISGGRACSHIPYPVRRGARKPRNGRDDPPATRALAQVDDDSAGGVLLPNQDSTQRFLISAPNDLNVTPCCSRATRWYRLSPALFNRGKTTGSLGEATPKSVNLLAGTQTGTGKRFVIPADRRAGACGARRSCSTTSGCTARVDSSSQLQRDLGIPGHSHGQGDGYGNK